MTPIESQRILKALCELNVSLQQIDKTLQTVVRASNGSKSTSTGEGSGISISASEAPPEDGSVPSTDT